MRDAVSGGDQGPDRGPGRGHLADITAAGGNGARPMMAVGEREHLDAERKDDAGRRGASGGKQPRSYLSGRGS